jgi:glyoxylase-like metal-dependent hydrolase (beta-lactamase superfamily II)/rhodanese-related sulfurtransferase
MSSPNIGTSGNSVESESFYRKIKQKEEFILLDVRDEEVSEEWSLDFKGIKTVNYPYYELVDGVPEELKNKLSFDTEIIVVCAKGKSSKAVAKNLRSVGYSTSSLEDGLNGWSSIYKKRRVPSAVDSISVYQYERPSSGCLGYMIVSDNEAVIIDPLKQYSDRYIRDAEELDASIEYVVDTHIHADHISGFKTLSDRTNAEMVMYTNSKNRGVKYEFETVENGDKIEFGSENLKVINTPGHTTDMTSYCIGNILFTGDSLFINSIARPDLENEDETIDMAEELYQTTHKIFNLPDNMVIAPGHKSDIHASDSLNQTFTKRLEMVRDDIGVSDYTKDEFVEYIIEDMPPRPANYERIIRINKGLEEVAKSEEYRLELGPNNCSSS